MTNMAPYIGVNWTSIAEEESLEIMQQKLTMQPLTVPINQSSDRIPDGHIWARYFHFKLQWRSQAKIGLNLSSLSRPEAEGLWRQLCGSIIMALM